MAMTWAGLILVVLCLLLAAGTVIGLVALMAHAKTRVVGVLLSLLVVLPLAGLALYVSAVRVASPLAPVGYEELGPSVRVYPSPQTKPASDRVIVELSTGSEDASGEGPKKVSSVLRILANAVLKALEEQERDDSLLEPAEPSLATTIAGEPLSSPRPAWVDREPQLVDGVYEMPISVGPYLTIDECRAKLPEELHKAVSEYVKRHHPGTKASQQVRLPLDYIQQHLVQAQWEERKQFSVGPMMRLHVLLGFDRQASERIRETWTRLVVQERIAVLAVIGTVALLLLATVYGYLRADLATGGRYRGRLRLAATTAMALVIAAVVLIAR